MNAGEISNIPSKPHSGFVGILVKHRELLEPGNRLQGNALIHQLALARALAEILDGFFQNATASINFDTSEVEHVIKPLAEKVAECIGKIETLGAELNQAKSEHERFRTSVLDRILELETRLIQLEHPAPLPDHMMDISVSKPFVGVVDLDAKETIVPAESPNVAFPPLVPSGRVGGRKRIE